MIKKIFKLIKIQIKGGQANPSPPVGPALGAAGVNIMHFCKEFNEKTQDKKGNLLPVLITVYEDKSFDLIIKTPPVSRRLFEMANITKGSSESNRKKVGTVTWDQVCSIANDKIVDLNCFTIEAAIKLVMGTARSMGIEVIKQEIIE